MKYLLGCILFICIAFTSVSQDTIYLHNDELIYSYFDNQNSSSIMCYIDSTGQLLFNDIIQKKFTKKISAYALHSECITNAYWYKLIVKNCCKRYQHFYIRIDYPITLNSIISLYDTTQRDNLIVKNGQLLSDSIKDITTSMRNAVTFNLNIGETKTLFLNIHINKPTKQEYLKDLSYVINLGSVDRWNKTNLTNRIYQGIVLGFLLLMFIYHLILFIKIKLKEYLVFSIYALSAAFYFALWGKFGYDIFGMRPLLFSLIAPICFSAYMLLALFYEDIKKYGKKTFNTLLIGFYCWTAMIIYKLTILILPEITVSYQSEGTILYAFILISLLITAYAILSTIYVFIPYIKLALKGRKTALYFLVANLIFLIGFILDLISKNDNSIPHALEFGFTGQMLVFAIGIADKMRSTLKERNESQKQLIEQLQVNTDLQEKVNRELEQKVLERTLEIEQQKEEIMAQSEEISTQRDILLQQNHSINDSIEYASYIQQALLSSSEILDNCHLSHFILYKPLNIVSGDFYWFKQVKNYIYFAVADCTGHGVPGAFMSVLGISLLNEIVGKRDLNSPATVLNEMRKKIKISLQQTESNSVSHDGMDMCLCLLDLETMDLQFAGAFNPLIVVRNNELIEYLVDRMPVGVHPKDAIDFTNKTIQLELNDTLYLFTDGYASQFGGETGKQLTRKRFKELLKEISKLPMAEQAEMLDKRHNEWRQKYEQVDDILVIGIHPQQHR